MGILLGRNKAEIARVGEVLAFTKLGGVGGSYNVNAIASAASSSDLTTYLVDAEIMAVTHPGLRLSVAGDSSIAIDDVFSRDSRTYYVFKIFKNYIGNEVADITVIAA